jgi:hypothetical protein
MESERELSSSEAAEFREAWKYALDRIDKQLEIEFTLITARMSWLVISQSFLFNAFVSAGGDFIKPPEVGIAIQITVAVMGLLIAMFVMLSVRAASDVITERKKTREDIERQLLAGLNKVAPGVTLPSVRRDDKRDRRGAIPSRFIPPWLIVGWVILLIALAYRTALHLGRI